jgi:hypothetical protein
MQQLTWYAKKIINDVDCHVRKNSKDNIALTFLKIKIYVGRK